MEFEPVIGVEIHVELKTKSKMFSSAPCTFGESPNSETVPYDLAFPGTMPVVNKEAVAYGIKVVTALNMTLDHTMYFDRKNYFYPDLPKGYQITQQFRPIGKNGYVVIETSQGEKKIRVEQAHLEEDTAKQIHLSDISLLNFNRCGTPLIEIVSEPDMRSGEEAMKYVEAIREIVTYLGVSDGKMENGSMRCDINISLRPKGQEKFGTKCECKNLNTIANIKSAVDYEIKRQTEILSNGGEVEQETRRYDEGLKQTVLMRKKTDAVDYKYFREPNIVPIDLDDGFIYDAVNSMNKLPNEYRKEFRQIGLNDYQIEELLKEQKFAVYFEECLEIGVKDPVSLWNLLTGSVTAWLNKNEVSLDELRFSKESLIYLSDALSSGAINSKQGKEVIALMLDEGRRPAEVIAEKGFEQISDSDEIDRIVNEVLEANAQSVSDYKNGKDRALGYLVGQVMKVSKGKANPSVAKEKIVAILGECPRPGNK